MHNHVEGLLGGPVCVHKRKVYRLYSVAYMRIGLSNAIVPIVEFVVCWGKGAKSSMRHWIHLMLKGEWNGRPR